MAYALTFLTVAAVILGIAYLLVIGGFCIGWINTPVYAGAGEPVSKVAVIVAARNEEKTIAACLEALLAQHYPAGLCEIIVVDDSSEDRTAEIVLSYASKHPRLRLLKLGDHGRTGKKQAISLGVSLTQAELIVTTDADCHMGKNWLKTIVLFYEESAASMIVAPVAFAGEKNAFEKMQSLELMALMGSTAGSLYFDKAILCNGANLAYRRELFTTLGGYRGIDHAPSGDDVLLMYRIAASAPGSIRFLRSREAIVHTSAKREWGEFIEQRKRWASKGLAAMNAEAKVISLLVYFFHFFLLALFVVSAFASIKSGIGLPFFKICLILIGFKCIIDYLLLFLAASFFDKKHYLYLFLPEQILYIFYVIVVGMLGSSRKYTWKGRRSIN